MKTGQNRIDTRELAAFLQAKISGFGELTGFNKFDRGQSNPTYLIETPDKNYVLRAKPPGKLLKSAHQVAREFKVMQALANSPVPVPEMLYLSPEESIIGQQFFVMEFLDGRIFWDPALSELSENGNPQRANIYDAMNKVLAALHSVEPASIGLADFGVTGNYYERQLSRWSSQYLSSEIDHNDDIHALIKWLEKAMPPDDGIITLVHGDFRLDNMVFHPENPEILGLLDWELSTLGHPMADLAYQCMQLRLPHAGGFKGLGGIDRDTLAIPHEQQYVKRYCERRGIGKIENWFFYLAFSYFRLAAILQGVYKRSLDGNASNPEKAKTYGAAVPIIGLLAIRMIREEQGDCRL